MVDFVLIAFSTNLFTLVLLTQSQEVGIGLEELNTDRIANKTKVISDQFIVRPKLT